MQRGQGYNPKRKIAPVGTLGEDERADLARLAIYRCSSYHKKHPAAYGLPPPAGPCFPRKTQCDGNVHFPKEDAERLLKSGFEKGMISKQQRGGWPQNVWAVSEAGMPFEAELENLGQGEYHGYPMAHDDPFRDSVLKAWGERW